MSKIKLNKLDRDRLKLQNLSSEDCQNIIGGMQESIDEYVLNNTSIHVICRFYPKAKICNRNEFEIVKPEDLYS